MMPSSTEYVPNWRLALCTLQREYDYPVRHDHAVESPFLPDDIRQESTALRNMLSVDLVVADFKYTYSCSNMRWTDLVMIDRGLASLTAIWNGFKYTSRRALSPTCTVTALRSCSWSLQTKCLTTAATP